MAGLGSLEAVPSLRAEKLEQETVAAYTPSRNPEPRYNKRAE
jgi:hypothetical protein